MGKRKVRMTVYVTAQTAWNLRRMAEMDGGQVGRVIDKLVRDRARLLREAEIRIGRCGT